MSEPYIAEVRIFGFNFAPRGWAQCDGQILPIDQNQAVFSLLGTNFGGDGRTTFALPDLRGRTPLHDGSGFVLGERGGEEAHALTTGEVPSHNHTVNCSSAPGNTEGPANNFWAAFASGTQYTTAAPNATMAAGIVSTTGGQGHENMQPYLTLNYCIALSGTFPPRN